jgi:transaldolase
MMNNLQRLEELGQSIWLDNISRDLIESGELKRMVGEGLLGVTSNPSIFEKAISNGADYDLQIRDLLHKDSSLGVAELLRALMIQDIQMATDVLRPVYERTNGRDGYVSVEVTPAKARETEATLEEVRLLWRLIDRRNLMVKIPATDEGLPAIEEALFEGININITLIFSVERYREVARAYLRALQRRGTGGKPPVSVASVFVSRVDTLVDNLIERKVSALPDLGKVLRPLRGRAAVANAKLVYEAFQEIFTSSTFTSLQARGASVQRPLWGSTSTKNPAYSDLLYVDNLIGRDTVNTVPPATYQAILDHGSGVAAIESGREEAREILSSLDDAGIEIRGVMKQLEEDGVAAFERSFDGLLHYLEKKRQSLLGAA